MKDSTADWEREPPASEEAIQALIREAGLDFPEEYLEFLRYSNGGEGQLGIHPLWFLIFPAEAVLEANRRYSYGLDDLPGYFVFGNNCGLELFVFNTEEPKPWRVYYVDNISMTPEDVLPCASNFESFVQAMGREPEPELGDDSPAG